MCKHIALVLDGNRRWGQVNNLSLSQAYKQGAQALKDTVSALIDLKIPYVTAYGFSFENWNRSCYEISVIMCSFLKFLEENLSFFIDNKIKVKFIGDLSFFDEKIYSVLMELEDLTSKYDAILLQLAVSYSGRKELEFAMQKSIALNLPIEKCLYSQLPDPELLIRTGGCSRLSNFLLWQVAYTELFFLDKLWPDFTKNDLFLILEKYKNVLKNKGA